MALFFLLIGLELKREYLEGELSKPKNIALSALGAVGGMAVPALIYYWFNAGDRDALQGWAIPAATDIAFVLGILALLGSRVPTSLKVFLTSLAIFAFCNAGIDFRGVGIEHFTHGVTLGTSFGLFFGKQIRILLLCWLGIRFRVASLPKGAQWMDLYGAAVLCGVGFTMSLFIGSLAFEETGANLLVDERIGILLGSLVSGIFGYLLLRKSLPRAEASKPLGG